MRFSDILFGWTVCVPRGAQQGDVMIDVNTTMFHASFRHEELMEVARHEAFLARNGLRGESLINKLINALRAVFASRTAPAATTAARPMAAK
jgi:hypothetical protein